MSSQRLVGTSLFAIGLLLYFVVIPMVSTGSSGSSFRADTFPLGLAIVLAGSGIGIALSRQSDATTGFESWATLGRMAVFFGIIAASVAAMPYLGYAVIAPILAAALMLTLGREALPLWLAIGAGVIPFTIVFVVENLLERSLP
jgi:hypothetical protein